MVPVFITGLILFTFSCACWQDIKANRMDGESWNSQRESDILAIMSQ
jgi:hypothetical protein